MNIYSTSSIVIGLLVAGVFVYLRFFAQTDIVIDLYDPQDPDVEDWILFLYKNQIKIFFFMIVFSISIIALRWRHFKRNCAKYRNVLKLIE